MGVEIGAVRLLALLAQAGVDPVRTLTLGRQSLHAGKMDLQRALMECGTPFRDGIVREDGYAEGFFEFLGAQTVDSMDASDYEHATHVHDLNLPLPVELKGRFSLVYDGGTLEHVFHFPQAIKNAMELVEVGGHFVGVTVCNNYVGHGFYQFSPELFFRVFSPENGFETRHVLVFETRKTGLDDGTMWRVEDPAKLGRRVLLQNASETLIAVVARKTDSVDIFAQTPQQSDYVASWDSETGNAFAEKPRRGLRALTRPARYALKRGVRPLSRASTGVRLALKPYEDPAYTRVRMDVSALKWLGR
ncbi:MAG: hypothetical protein U0S12_01555 [Fimbriimonadales bacterium]